MANTVAVNFRMDADLKKRADELFEMLGMNLSTALNVFTRKAVNVHGIPFKVDVDPYSGKGWIDRNLRAIKQVEQTGAKYHNLIEV